MDDAADRLMNSALCAAKRVEMANILASLEDRIHDAIARNSLGQSLWCRQDVRQYLSEARQRVQAARAMVAAEITVSEKAT
jgi:hypothetical protein